VPQGCRPEVSEAVGMPSDRNCQLHAAEVIAFELRNQVNKVAENRLRFCDR